MKNNLEKIIFMICPVRGITKEEKEFLKAYVAHLEALGHKVHWPVRDTNQDDSCGLNICMQNREGIKKADEIHIYWNPKSGGSKLDLGMTFMAEKPLYVINRYMVKKTPHKSFENFILALDSQYIERTQ